MTKTLAVPFAKYHGLGNDFLVVLEKDIPTHLPDFVRRILDRHSGVGADGLIVVAKADFRNHDARIRFFNADGSEAEMSGNGIRCAGAFLVEGDPRKRALQIETLAGLRPVEREGRGEGKWTFRVRMGTPILEAARIPFYPPDVPSPILQFPLPTHVGELPVTVISMGNPHCSVFVADFEKVDWLKLGQEIETSEHFPHRTNVEFVRLISKNEIEVRFWERGVGHTLASGTGSCGASVAAILNGLIDRHVCVRTEAGSLDVAWPQGGEVVLTGPVERVAKGTYFCLKTS